MNDTIHAVTVGGGAAGAVEIIHQLPLNEVIKAAIQVIIGIATLLHLFSKKKSLNDKANEN